MERPPRRSGRGAVADNASVAFNCAAELSIGNAIGGTGTVTKEGTGTTTFTGGNSYTGWTAISGGTLQIGDGGSLGTADVTDNASLAFDCGSDLTIPNAIDGTGSVLQQGSGTTSLAGATRIPARQLLAGTLQIDDRGAGFPRNGRRDRRHRPGLRPQ